MKGKARTIIIILGLGMIYYIWLRLTNLAIPCIFRKVTGWLCPGCGITTLIICLAKLDFQGAYHANPFLFITGPFLLIELIYYDFLKMSERELPKWNHYLVVGYTIILCVFGVWRNLV